MRGGGCPWLAGEFLRAADDVGLSTEPTNCRASSVALICPVQWRARAASDERLNIDLIEGSLAWVAGADWRGRIERLRPALIPKELALAKSCAALAGQACIETDRPRRRVRSSSGAAAEKATGTAICSAGRGPADDGRGRRAGVHGHDVDQVLSLGCRWACWRGC